MGLDLALIIERQKLLQGEIDGYDRLGLGRDYDLFQQIDNVGRSIRQTVCRPRPLAPDMLLWYDKDGLEECRVDSYDNPLTWLPAGELAKIDTDETLEWNRAVFEMIRGLEIETRIVLFWH